MSETLGPWPAFARTGPSHRSNRADIVHGTRDGVTTLCGLKEIGGYDRYTVFMPNSAFACKRCAAKVSESPL